MATREFIEKRISGAEAKVQKLNSKMERILKAQESNWEVNPYYYDESDIRRTQKEIDKANASLEKYVAELKIFEEKEASRNVEVLIQFLDSWKERMEQYYKGAMLEYKSDLAKLDELRANYDRYSYGSFGYEEAKKAYDEFYAEFNENLYGKFETQRVKDMWMDWTTHTLTREVWREKKVKVGEGKWEYAKDYLSRNYEYDLENLRKDLAEEANRKYDDIIERTNYIVGQITDASNLKVGAKGDLNGYIEGTKGKAKVQTIGAGGYNVQCYHFRTLINKMK